MSAAKALGAMPAYPVPIAAGNDGCIYDAMEATSGRGGGMTKRERFAMAAMQGMLANPVYAAQGSVAAAALYHADAMLAELAKDQP